MVIRFGVCVPAAFRDVPPPKAACDALMSTACAPGFAGLAAFAFDDDLLRVFRVFVAASRGMWRPAAATTAAAPPAPPPAFMRHVGRDRRLIVATLV
jgi:hypothetical protein